MTDDLVGQLLLVPSCNTQQMEDLCTEAAARIEALEGALMLIAARDRQREWTATADNPESHWVERDGQYATIARAALAKDKSDG